MTTPSLRQRAPTRASMGGWRLGRRTRAGASCRAGRACAWRLQILLRDLLPGRSCGAGRSWTAVVGAKFALLGGGVPAAPPHFAALARTRRRTDGVGTLKAQSPSYVKPLRVLVVSDSAPAGRPGLALWGQRLTQPRRRKAQPRRRCGTGNGTKPFSAPRPAIQVGR